MNPTPEAAKADIAAPSALDLYKLARSHVEHENSLVSQRITWYLTLQGFLFTASFLTLTTLLDPAKKAMLPLGRLYMAIAVGLLFILGIGSSIACYLLIRAAYAQIDSVSMWWNGHPMHASFPKLSGSGGFLIAFNYRVTGADFVHVILVTWIVLAGMLVRAAMKGA